MAKMSASFTLQRLRNRAFSLVANRLVEAGLLPKAGYGLAQMCAAIGKLTASSAPTGKKKQWRMIVEFAVDRKIIESLPVTARPEPTPKKPKKTSKAKFHAFYMDKPWRSLRYEALKVHGAKCQCCGGTPASTGKPMHVDHIKPRSKFPELELTLSNLQVLCEDCNMGKGGRDQTDWRFPTPTTS